MTDERKILPAALSMHGQFDRDVEPTLGLAGIGSVVAAYSNPDDRHTLHMVGRNPAELWLIADVGLVKVAITLKDHGAEVAAEVTPWVAVQGVMVRAERNEQRDGGGRPYIQWRYRLDVKVPKFVGAEERVDGKREPAFDELQAFGRALIDRLPRSPSV